MLYALRTRLLATSTVVLVCCFAGSAQAEEPAPSDAIRFEPVGSFFSRYELRENYGPATDFVRYRARFGAQTNRFDIGNDNQLRLRFVPQAAGLWHVGGDSTGDVALGLHEGFVELGFMGNTLQAGRFEMVYGDHLVIGNVDWHESGRAFDGARLSIGAGDVDVDVFATTLSEGFADDTSNSEIGGGDVWFFGVYTKLGGLLGDGHALDLYLLNRLAPRATGPDTDTTAELTAGARVKGASAGVDWRAEAGVQVGRHPMAEVDALAYQADGELGYTVGQARNLRVGLNGFVASGDDPDTAETDEGWNQLFPTAHKWLGLMDFIGARTNVAGAALLLSSQLHARWKAYANVHEFHRLQDGAQPAGRVGTEVDLGVRFAIGQGTGLRFGYGLFAPTDEVSDELLHFGEAELRVDLP